MNDNAPFMQSTAARLTPAIVAFCRPRIGREFHADDLRAFVAGSVGCAPASSDRVLRHLRQRGVIGYSVINRRASLYRIDNVKETA